MTADALEAQLAALATMSVHQLRIEWRRLYGTDPNPGLGSPLMRRGIAYRLQEQVHGGLRAATTRELTRLAQQLEQSGDLDVERQLSLKVGTRLVREWHGRTCHVMVLDRGFLFEDRRYSSLTQIARAVTGAKWSGPRFFGLRQRSRPQTEGGASG